MKQFSDISLQSFHTFKVDIKAQEMIVIEHENELIHLPLHHLPFLILGGGSNVLFIKNFEGTIIKNELKGRCIIKETENDVTLNIKSGEIWHDIVMWSVNNNWNGIENLALIPGTAGAAPIQNIGAYGVEIKNVLESVRYYHFEKKCFETLENNECAFGYRNSIFKTDLKNKVFITDITLKLNKKNHVYHIDYGNIQEELNKMNVQNLSPKIIAEAVMNIRKSKLPNPEIIGNAGSFFKNPEVTENVYLRLKEKYPDLIAFATGHQKYKLAAGWLIEKCGLKGYTYKGAAVHDKQALVLINKNHATGKDIYELSEKIVEKIFDTFGIMLEREVNIIE